MTSAELDALPVVMPFLASARALAIGRNQAHRMHEAGTFPVRVLKINGGLKVSKFDLLSFLGAVREEPAAVADVRDLRAVQGGAA